MTLSAFSKSLKTLTTGEAKKCTFYSVTITVFKCVNCAKIHINNNTNKNNNICSEKSKIKGKSKNKLPEILLARSKSCVGGVECKLCPTQLPTMLFGIGCSDASMAIMQQFPILNLLPCIYFFLFQKGQTSLSSQF